MEGLETMSPVALEQGDANRLEVREESMRRLLVLRSENSFLYLDQSDLSSPKRKTQ